MLEHRITEHGTPAEQWRNNGKPLGTPQNTNVTPVEHPGTTETFKPHFNTFNTFNSRLEHFLLLI